MHANALKTDTEFLAVSDPICNPAKYQTLRWVADVQSPCWPPGSVGCGSSGVPTSYTSGSAVYKEFPMLTTLLHLSVNSSPNIHRTDRMVSVS